MNPQGMLKAKLQLENATLNWKAVCVLLWVSCFLFSLRPPIHLCRQQTTLALYHPSCLYRYYRAASTLFCVLWGEIEITTRQNIHLFSSPHLKLPLWYGHLQGLYKGQGSRRVLWASFCNPGDAGGLTPLQCPDVKLFLPPVTAQLLLHKHSTQSILS